MGNTFLLELGRKTLWKDNELPRWMAMEILWKRKAVSMGSSVTSVILCPRAWMNSMAAVHHAPPVSIAIGTKWWVVVNDLYLMFLLIAAVSAAAPATHEVWLRCDAAYVSGTVTSQTRGFPCDHGRSVTPSGRFPSERDKPRGSLEDGIWALLMALHMMSLSGEWRM